MKQKPKPVIRVLCEGCDRVLPHYALGLCRQCYRKQYVAPDPPKGRCTDCMQWKVLHARERCNACYMAWWRKRSEQRSATEEVL